MCRKPNKATMLKFISAILLLLCITHIHAGDIIELTDANFEHETQASTGMTTGSWFILFKAEQCAHCKRVLPELKQLAEDPEVTDAGIVLATIDVPSNRRTSVRFGVRGFPTLILLHKGNVYKFKGKRHSLHMKAFLLESVPSMKGEPIPEPLGVLTEMIQTIKAAGMELHDLVSGKSGMAGIGIVVLITLFFGLIIALIAICFLPGSNDKEKKT